MIDLVVFDLGRVLVRICDDWPQACRQAKIDWPHEWAAFFTVPVLADLGHQFEVGKIDFDGFCRGVAEHAKADAAAVRSIMNAWLLGPFPGAVELLDELRSAGVRTACLSNTNAAHWTLMTTHGGANYLPLERLDHAFASHLIGARKPDDAIYEHLERQTGVKPHRIAFFDDLEPNVATAARRGWHAHPIAVDGDPIAQVRRHLKSHGVIGG